MDTVSMSNGNLFFQATLLSYPQRGNFSYPTVLQYNNETFSFWTAHVLRLCIRRIASIP